MPQWIDNGASGTRRAAAALEVAHPPSQATRPQPGGSRAEGNDAAGPLRPGLWRLWGLWAGPLIRGARIRHSNRRGNEALDV